MREHNHVAETSYETEWPVDEDGIPHRQAARVVLLSPDGRAYLILGHDVDDRDHRWWFTPGGGIMPGESAPCAAVRELREETGLAVQESRLIGPVLSRKASFHFVGLTRRQDELFYLLRATDDEVTTINSGRGRSLTAVESRVLDDQAWWSVGEMRQMRAQGQNVYPRQLPELIVSWLGGWDGVLRELDERDSS